MKWYDYIICIALAVILYVWCMIGGRLGGL